jgi:hypothetical protein
VKHTDANNKFIRTKQRVRQHLKDLLKHWSVKEDERKMNSNADDNLREATQ